MVFATRSKLVIRRYFAKEVFGFDDLSMVCLLHFWNYSKITNLKRKKNKKVKHVLVNVKELSLNGQCNLTSIFSNINSLSIFTNAQP